MKVSIKQYSQTLFELTSGKSEQEVLVIVAKFAEALKKDGQLKNAGKIMEKYSELYNISNGIVVAEITTRYKIQDTRYKEVESFIKSKYKAEKVEISNIVDESIGGGIVIKIGDEIIDSSISGKLERLRRELVR
jgi:F-type H+-transporting ATPase subunit delta